MTSSGEGGSVRQMSCGVTDSGALYGTGASVGEDGTDVYV